MSWTQVYRYIGGSSTTHSRLTPLPKEPSRISLMYLTFLETRIIHLLSTFFCWQFVSIFIQFFSGGRRNFPQDFSISKRGALAYGSSRSSKVTDIGANRKRICDFLLVRNSNFGPILHRFGARTRFMCSWPHPYSTLIFGVFPLHQIADVGRQRAHRP